MTDSVLFNAKVFDMRDNFEIASDESKFFGTALSSGFDINTVEKVISAAVVSLDHQYKSVATRDLNHAIKSVDFFQHGTETKFIQLIDVC